MITQIIGRGKRIGLVAVVLISLLSSSCGSKKSKLDTSSLPLINKDASLKDRIGAAHYTYQWLKLNGNIKVLEGEGSGYPSAGLQMKLRQDSLAWGSVSFFVELGRALIKPEGATVMMKQEKVYYELDKAGLQRLAGIPGLSLEMLQKLMSGDAPMPILASAKETEITDSIQVVQSQKTFRETLWLDPTTYKLKRYYLGKNLQEYVDIQFKDYKIVDEKLVPMVLLIKAKQGGEVSLLEIKWSSAQFLAKDEAPFTIPSSFKKGN